MGKKGKIILGTATTAFLATTTAALFVGNYFYNLALNPSTDKSIVHSGNKNEDTTVSTEKEKTKDWLLGESGYTDVALKSEDGLKLHGYEVTNEKESTKWVITVHGYTSEGKLASPYAKRFNEMGFNVLIPDLRGHGTSEGDYIGMGWHDRKDIISWINYIISKEPDAQIILHGVSMGGATVMMTSGEDLPSNVKAIIEDCGYTSVDEEFTYQLNKLFGLPKFPIINAASVISKIRAGYSLGEASAIEQVKKAKVPMLFIHGDNDAFVPSYMLDEVYNAANVEKEKVVVEGAEHANSYEVNPQLYWTSIYNFINKYVQ